MSASNSGHVLWCSHNLRSIIIEHKILRTEKAANMMKAEKQTRISQTYGSSFH